MQMDMEDSSFHIGDVYPGPRGGRWQDSRDPGSSVMSGVSQLEEAATPFGQARSAGNDVSLKLSFLDLKHA